MNRLRECRKKKKLTLEQLSKELAKNGLKLTPDAISKYERRDREPKIKVWEKFSEFYGIPINYLQGRGWSQQEVLIFLTLMLISLGDEVESPSGRTVDPHFISMYGDDNESLDELDIDDLPGFRDEAKEYIKLFKSNEIEHSEDFIEWLDIDDEEDIGADDIDSYVEDNLDTLIDTILLPEDIEEIRSNIKESIDTFDIDLYSSLTKLLPEEGMDFFRWSLLYDFNCSLTVNNFKSRVRQSDLEVMFSILLKHIDLVSDYEFLSNVGENEYKTGVIPEYEIAKQLQNELKSKEFEKAQDYLKANPQKAIRGLVNSMDLTASDKKTTIDIISFLVNEISALQGRVSSLANQLKDREREK